MPLIHGPARPGRLSSEAKIIYDYLLDHPMQPTRDLRRGTRLSEKAQKLATERALVDLQRRFLVCKADLTGRTRGTYSYVWDLPSVSGRKPLLMPATPLPRLPAAPFVANYMSSASCRIRRWKSSSSSGHRKIASL